MYGGKGGQAEILAPPVIHTMALVGIRPETNRID